MKKYLQIYIVPILLVFLASCQGQNQADQLNENLSQQEMVLLDSMYTIQKVDTIWSPNAPSRITRKIRPDKEGNLLFAAYQDIIRYDGLSFTNLTKEEGLDSYDAFDVWEDKNGSLWIASTHFGVFQHPGSTELKTGEKALKHFTPKNGLAHDRTMCIYEDRAGGVWIGTEGGISYYDGKTLSNGPIAFRNFTIENGLNNNNINTIMEDKTGKIWVGTRGGLSVYDPLTTLNPGEITFTDVTDNEGKAFSNIWSILEDKRGNIWLGGQHGFWRYDGNSFANLNITNVGAVYEDKKGNVWFIHKTGLSCYDQKSLLSSEPKATPIFTGQGMFFGLTEDKYGGIWIGKLDGVFRYDGKSITYFKDGPSKRK